MFTNALSAVGSRLDSKFLAAYWLPAFVGFLGALGVLIEVIGLDQVDYWRQELGSLEKGTAVVLAVLGITMGALFLRSMTRPIAEFFAGQAMPRVIAQWSANGQRQAMRGQQKATRDPEHTDGGENRYSHAVARRFPSQDANVQPTLLGNVLASAAEHPRLAYAMEAMIWWPRLSPLLPEYFQEMMSTVQSPMMALLNLAVVLGLLAVGGGVVLAGFAENWFAAITLFAGGLALAWLCYRAALRQALEFASMIQVGFDLYRHEILRQMDLEVPGDLDAEREIWQTLTAKLYHHRYGIEAAPEELPPTPPETADAPPEAEDESPTDAGTAAL